MPTTAGDDRAGRPDLGRRVVAGTLWSMLGIAALGLTRLIYNALIGRTGDPSRLAEVNAQVSLAFVVTFFTAAATAAGATKFISLCLASQGAAAAAAVRRRLAGWTLTGSLLAVTVVLPLGRFVLPQASFGDVAWVGALIVAYGAYTFTKAVLYAYNQASRYAALELVSDGAALTLTVVAVLWFPGYLLAPLVVGYAGFAVAAHLSAPRPPAHARSVRATDVVAGRELRGFVGYTALGIAASQGLFQLSMVIARQLSTGEQAGAYAAAMSLVTPAFFLPRALAMAFFPAAATAVGRGATSELARYTEATTRVLALAALPCFAVAAMLGAPVLGLVFGSAYTSGGPVFALLVLAVLGYVVAVPSVNALSAHALALARIPPVASGLGVVVAGLVWAGAWLVSDAPPVTSVAAGYLAAMVLQAGVPLVVASRRLRVAWGGAAVRFAATLGVGVTLGIVAVGVQQLWVTAGCVAGFLVVYAVVLGPQARDALRQVRDLGRAS